MRGKFYKRGREALWERNTTSNRGGIVLVVRGRFFDVWGHGAFAFLVFHYQLLWVAFYVFFIFNLPHLVVVTRSQGLENGEKMENNSQ